MLFLALDILAYKEEKPPETENIAALSIPTLKEYLSRHWIKKTILAPIHKMPKKASELFLVWFFC